MAALLEIRALKKRYGKLQAVDGVDLAIEEGRCFGLLGPNGAGKTTTIEMMEGILSPDSGEIRYRGKPIDASYREEIGIQFQNTALQDFLSVREVLQMFRSLYKNPEPIEELIRRCALSEFVDRYATKLSGGQRQRLLLALALLNDPNLIFLDEPTTGLDPQARRNFWDLVIDIKRRKKTVVLTTHYMEEAHLLCDEIAIVDHGRVIAQGTPDALLSKHFEGLAVRLPRETLPDLASRMGDKARVAVREDYFEIRTVDVSHTLRDLMAANVSLAGLAIHRPTLEDLFLELTGKELRT